MEIMVAMFNGCSTRCEPLVRSGALTETFCEVCSSQYRSQHTQLSP